MAGDWIKMQKSLPRDPRVIRIASALNADRLRTVGGLFSAWCLFDEQTETGKLEAYTPDLLDELVGCPGLARAMESVGWLEVGEGFIAVPRFDEHNGQSAKRRAQDANRKYSSRQADKCPHSKRTENGLEKNRDRKEDREEDRKKVFPVSSPEGETPKSAKKSQNSTDADKAEEIYQAYPRKCAKDDALKAILKAMKKHSPDFLLEKTQFFSAAIAWNDKQFIPYPATWFNAGHFNDDPEEWKQPGTNNRPPATTGAHRVIHVGGRKPSGIMTFDDEPPEDKQDLLSIVHAYPRRQDDAEALECVAASIRKGADPSAILAGTRAIAAIIPQLPSGHLNAFVVSAGTFFRKEKWRDDPQTWLRNAGHKNGSIAAPLNLGGRKPGPPIESFSNSEFKL